MRRGTGQGDLIWDRMAFDDQWQVFIESLWDYQYTHKEAVLGGKTDLSKTLYEETQGITDLAIKTFIFAQQRAIESGEEKITAAIIRSVAKDKFKMLRNALKAMKNKDKRALFLYEDLYPVFKDNAGIRTLEIIGEVANAPEIKAKLDSKIDDLQKSNKSKAEDCKFISDGKIT